MTFQQLLCALEGGLTGLRLAAGDIVGGMEISVSSLPGIVPCETRFGGRQSEHLKPRVGSECQPGAVSNQKHVVCHKTAKVCHSACMGSWLGCEFAGVGPSLLVLFQPLCLLCFLSR